MGRIQTQQDWYATVPWIDRPGADIDAYVDGLPELPDFDLKSKLTQWREQGIVTFENVVDRKLIAALMSDLDYLKEHYRDFELVVEVRGGQRDIRDLAFSPVSRNRHRRYESSVTLGGDNLSHLREVMSMQKVAERYGISDQARAQAKVYAAKLYVQFGLSTKSAPAVVDHSELKELQS